MGGRIDLPESPTRRRVCSAIKQVTSEAEAIVGQSAQLCSVDAIEILDKGFSDERKYILWENGNRTYLLRTSGIEKLLRRRQDFDLLSIHYKRGIRCSPPLEFGVHEPSQLCYALLGYISGESGADAIPKLPEATQYEIGMDAGRELLGLHELRHPNGDAHWFEGRVAKYEKKVAQARQHGLTFRGEGIIQRYIETSISLLRESEVRFQHDDYHPDNLIICEGKFKGVIDFNRCDWGDPVEDFYKVPWFTTAISIPFARGQVEGYLGVVSPDHFWERYNLLVALNLHGSLVFAHQEGMDWWPERLDKIVSEHDFEQGGPPRWFVEDS